jgi:hypothetical protein
MNLEQRGLAGAVAADQPDAFAGLKGKLSVVKERMVAEGQLRGGQGNDSHGGIDQMR